MRPPACDSARVALYECVVASGDHLAMLFVSHHTIALGAGGIKANVLQPRSQGGEGHDLLLQPFLLLHQPRLAVRGHGAGGTRRYRYRRPQGSPLTVMWRVFLSAWEKRRE
ncbi:unnamed protein product [Musa acuminata subsp. burmannicoides]